MQEICLYYSSKDTFVKFWDLETQHCFKTLVEHRSEVYDFVVVKDDTRLVTGSADSELRVWDIHYDTEVMSDDIWSTAKDMSEIKKFVPALDR